MPSTSSHEHKSHTDEGQPGSERAFGIVFAVVFALIAAFPLIKGNPIHLWAVIVSAVFLGLAFLWPRALAPLNRVWFRFGLFLHSIVNPVIMGMLFFATITPIALLMRLFGKDPLRMKLDKTASTYWIERTPPGPSSESMKNQF